jgi:uncharacterized membrane protein
MSNNVILIKFAEPAKAYEQLAELKRTSGGPYTVGSAAVLARDTEGRLATKDGFDNESGTGTAIGGLIGLFLGFLGGPIGVLLGWSGGALLGAVSDLGNLRERAGVADRAMHSIEPGQTAVFVHLKEPDASVLDKQVADAGGTLQRWSSADLLSDLQAAREAEAQATAAARKSYQEEHSGDHKAKLQEWLSSLKQGFQNL